MPTRANGRIPPDVLTYRVIEVQHLIGRGTDREPSRLARSLYTEAGEHIVTLDPHYGAVLVIGAQGGEDG